MQLLNRPLTYFLCLMFAGCASSNPYTKTVSKVDIKRFMIPWYVQAGRFTPFEKDPYNGIETYKWNELEQRIDIEFTFNQGALNGPIKKIPQKGWIKDKVTNATWTVQPFWPLKFDFLIIALDEDNYEWAAIGVPSQKWLWVMTRSQQYSREKIKEILKEIENMGYSIEKTQFVQHGE